MPTNILTHTEVHLNTINLADGKYTVLHTNGTGLRALRYGEPWRNMEGDGLVLAMAQRIEELETVVAALGFFQDVL